MPILLRSKFQSPFFLLSNLITRHRSFLVVSAPPAQNLPKQPKMAAASDQAGGKKMPVGHTFFFHYKTPFDNREKPVETTLFSHLKTHKNVSLGRKFLSLALRSDFSFLPPHDRKICTGFLRCRKEKEPEREAVLAKIELYSTPKPASRWASLKRSTSLLSK